MAKKIFSSLKIVESADLSKAIAQEIEDENEEEKNLAELLDERQDDINNTESV